ncbi:MAG: CsbD family protein [Sandaracinus sp.]|nr:CsbD family protein [Myxococcales bacterium]MCB9612866.1 CsbD family protein [Sandaracinus sp.]MCB9618155.1 CsbD family protein [Sandaracinus sp.]MCB9625316.1 CsbD family protein [Sandaracinus sp.]MCB9633413.1 CsbD family protein [Sandaracinus sp.]
MSIQTETTKKKIEGKAQQLKGAVKEKVGDATGNRKLEAKGKIEKAAGKAKAEVADAAGKVASKTKQVAGKVERAVEKKIDAMRDKH